MPKTGKRGYFWPKIITFKLFCKSIDQVLLKSYLMTNIKKWAKVTVLDFEGKFMFCSKWCKWIDFWPGIICYYLLFNKPPSPGIGPQICWKFLKLHPLKLLKSYFLYTQGGTLRVGPNQKYLTLDRGQSFSTCAKVSQKLTFRSKKC